MASDVPLRSAGLPSQQEVTELLAAEFARAGYDIEDVTVVDTAKPPRIVVVEKFLTPEVCAWMIEGSRDKLTDAPIHQKLR